MACFRDARVVRTGLLAAVIAAALGGQRGIAEKVVTLREFEQAMMLIGTAVKSGADAIAAAAYPDAKARLVLARQTLASTIPFWSDRKISEAAAMTRTAVRALDDVDTALSRPPVDAAAVRAAAEAMNGACAVCHDAYREGDRETGYRIKRGVVTP